MISPSSLLAILLIGALVFSCVVTVRQGTVAVTTVFGKFNRILRPGLNFKIPFIERVLTRISYQNRSIELKFQAITQDQANVNFSAMLLYSVLNQENETIKNVAFKFMDQQSFMQALIRSVEGAVRAFVATRRQSEVLLLRTEIILHVKEQLDRQLEDFANAEC